MDIKFTKGEGMDKVTTKDGFVFDRYFSIVDKDAFDAYSSFIYLVVTRLDRRNPFL
jgi:hypothetical protein